MLKEEHEHIIRLRNGYVAHAGADLDKCLVVGTVIDIGFAIGFDIGCQLAQPINMTSKLNDFKRLCEFVKAVVTVKIERALNKVMEYATNLNDTEFRKVVKTPAKDNLFKLVETEKNLLKIHRTFNLRKSNDRPDVN